MSGNTFGKLFTVTTFGESHGAALGCIVDGCPPGLPISEEDLQHDLDRRRPGTSKYTTQRREPDQVKILSGIFEGKTTGTPIGLLIENTDQRSRDYGNIMDRFRPGHADYSYNQKIWISRLPRGWALLCTGNRYARCCRSHCQKISPAGVRCSGARLCLSNW